MESEKGKGKHSKIRIEQFDQIFPHIGGVGLFQITYAIMIGKVCISSIYWRKTKKSTIPCCASIFKVTSITTVEFNFCQKQIVGKVVL